MDGESGKSYVQKTSDWPLLDRVGDSSVSGFGYICQHNSMGLALNCGGNHAAASEKLHGFFCEHALASDAVNVEVPANQSEMSELWLGLYLTIH